MDAKGATKIDEPYHPRYRLCAELHEYVFFWKVFQAVCGHEPTGV